MSLNTLANAAAARRTDVGPVGTVPSGILEIAAAAAMPPEIASPDKQQASGVTTALNVLFGYIPTEVVILYVAVVGALQPAAAGSTSAATALAGTAPLSRWIAFWCFFAVTPLAVWVIYAIKIKAIGRPVPLTWGELPLWEMIAALLSFFVWAFALPNTPFREFSWFSAALASIVVLFASTILGLIAPLFQRPLSKGIG